VNKSKRGFEHTLGLGQTPNIVPHGVAEINGEPRKVELGWHPVGGMAGKWFAEKTWFGKGISKEIGTHPDPSQHWAILVGDYVHELWMDENFDVIYINEEFKREDWHTFEVGTTRFSDQALVKAGRMTIHNMQQKRKAYNLISNNCQNFAVNLLDAIQVGAHAKFATSFQVYQAATGEGEIKDLFEDKHPDDQGAEEATDATEHPDGGVGAKTSAAQHAQHVMDDNTTKLDHNDYYADE